MSSETIDMYLQKKRHDCKKYWKKSTVEKYSQPLRCECKKGLDCKKN